MSTSGESNEHRRQEAHKCLNQGTCQIWKTPQPSTTSNHKQTLYHVPRHAERKGGELKHSSRRRKTTFESERRIHTILRTTSPTSLDLSLGAPTHHFANNKCHAAAAKLTAPSAPQHLASPSHKAPTRATHQAHNNQLPVVIENPQELHLELTRISRYARLQHPYGGR